ncbi:Protein kinase domain [Dillenia turbinata]|uniref:Protein kinase domain n=1 Tax=Dillenia turbinata TaxID=194707 RepID=A0AAN8W0H6_9MAGN
MKFCFSCSNCSSSAQQIVVDRTLQGDQSHLDFRVFTYNELKIATQNFCPSNKIGEGGFGRVYKGQLKDGTLVAVKVLSVEKQSIRGERVFISEISALSNIKHENLIKFQGCCVDGAERLLVYDYMENKSLSQTLLGKEENRVKFSWRARRDISLGVARGVAYLHEEVEPHIVHRDIKASNILLDKNFTPKVSDFGLAKLFREDVSHISTRVAGTLGYLSPEYAISGHLTPKSDVYSFGVLLLEVITGRSVVDFDLELGEHFLVEKAWKMYITNNLVSLVDPILNGDFPEDEAVRFLKVGLLCVQQTVSRRPRMPTTIKMLTNEIDITNTEINRPGLVENFMDVKVGGKRSTDIFAKGSASY